MATVTSKTAAVIQAIDDALIESANISSLGHLQLIRRDSSVIDAGSIGAPSGSIIMFGGSVVPQGWLMCNGQAVSRTGFADLFAAIGTQHGNGDGSTTFNVPNMEQKMPRMDSTWLGWPGGGTTHTHAHVDHTHTVAAHDHNLDGGSTQAHARMRQVNTGGVAGKSLFIERITVPGFTSTQSLDSIIGADETLANCVNGVKVAGMTNTKAVTTDGGGADSAAGSNLPPYINLNFIIKV